MFDKDTKLIYEAYEVQKVNEGKMKDIVTAIEAGDDVDEIISSLKLNDTEEVRAMITKARDNFYEQGERGEDAENCPMSDEEGEDAEELSQCLMKRVTYLMKILSMKMLKLKKQLKTMKTKMRS